MSETTVPAATTLRLLAASSLVILPHFGHLPLWAMFGIAGFMSWRAIAAFRHWRMPARWARMLLLALVVVGVYAQYGRLNGQHPGTTLLILLLGVKLTELNSPRDHAVLILFSYVVLATQFLFSQELPQLLWLFAGSLAVTMAMLDLSRPNGPLAWRDTLRRSSALLLQGIPLMLLLFILFPRISGPLWGLPADTGQAKIGLSDSMSPGSISGLTDTGAVAFRVRFFDPAPDTTTMYWRGPIFWQFDGRSWRGDPATSIPAADFSSSGPALSYQVTLEAHRKRWLFALDMPTTLPPKAIFSSSRQILSKEKLRERLLYRASSVLEYQLESRLPAATQQAGLQLPDDSNPRSRELAQSWREAGLSPAQISRRALTMFREQPFVYTLQPPLLGRDGIDEFLFGTRRGFCEHYAGAYTFLMRAAGVPARVVTGYQGAEYNEVGDYYIVRQSDAHAWSEIWLADRGWVRVDPTAAVSPERIEQGLTSAFAEVGHLPAILSRGFPLLYQLQMRWDWINHNWYEWVLAYGPQLQRDFLGRLGLADWGRMILALTLLSTLFLGILGTAFIWQSRQRPQSDAIQQLWLRFCHRLAAQGLTRAPTEGPLDYMQRTTAALPTCRSEIEAITKQYLELRYGQGDTKTGLPMLKQRIARFKPG